jgi:hypothetical protein
VEIWTIESSPRKQSALAWVIIVAGLVLAYGFRDFDSGGFTNSLAGFLLGVLLLAVGIPAAVMGGKQQISVDPGLRRILVEDTRRWGKKSRSIPFDEIAGVRVDRLGNRSDGSVSYYVALKLSTGKTYPLFFPAYYDGRWNRSVAEERCRRIEEYLGRSNPPPGPGI